MSRIDYTRKVLTADASCLYDGGIDGGPTCGAPATTHLIALNGPEPASLWACPEHTPIAQSLATDWHSTGDACGMPGTYWQHRHRPGLSFCVWPEGDAIAFEVTMEHVGNAGLEVAK